MLALGKWLIHTKYESIVVFNFKIMYLHYVIWQTSEYGIPSDYVSDVEQSSSETNSDWLGCASRHTGIPQWLLALTILGVALSALWIYLESNEPKEPPPVGLLKEYLEEDDLPTNVIVYLPDEAPLYKEPPPTYNSAENLTEEEEESE